MEWLDAELTVVKTFHQPGATHFLPMMNPSAMASGLAGFSMPIRRQSPTPLGRSAGYPLRRKGRRVPVRPERIGRRADAETLRQQGRSIEEPTYPRDFS